MHGSIADLIDERRAIPETDWPNDLLSRLAMEARDPDTGEAMTETLWLRDESITVFFAGHETTARTMAAASVRTRTHPAVAARLHEEPDLLGDHALNSRNCITSPTRFRS